MPSVFKRTKASLVWLEDVVTWGDARMKSGLLCQDEEFELCSEACEGSLEGSKQCRRTLEKEIGREGGKYQAQF